MTPGDILVMISGYNSYTGREKSNLFCAYGDKNAVARAKHM